MGRSFLERLLSKNFRNENNIPKTNQLQNSAPKTKKKKIIFYRKITNKSCNTSTKAKPIDN